MISWLRRRQKAFFVATIAIFLIGTFVGLGGYLFTNNDMAESVAAIGKVKIPYLRYQQRVNNYIESLRQNEKDVTDDMAKEVRQGMLRDMIVDELLRQQADKLGIRVTDLELGAAIQNSPRFQREGKFDQWAYFRAVRDSLHMTPEEFETDQRSAMQTAKLKQLLFQSVKVLPAELHDEYLRAHQGSDKDFDKKRDEFLQSIQQTRAIDLINFYLKQLTTQVEIRTFLEQREQGQ